MAIKLKSILFYSKLCLSVEELKIFDLAQTFDDGNRWKREVWSTTARMLVINQKTWKLHIKICNKK